MPVLILTFLAVLTGGKDSTVLAHMLTTLNARHDYGLDLFLLSIDEGITGYRDDSLETVRTCSVMHRQSSMLGDLHFLLALHFNKWAMNET